MDYTIIDKNIEKLEFACKSFPEILGRYRKSTCSEERNRLSGTAGRLGLSPYINFIKWLEERKDQIIKYNFEISFDTVKSAVIEGLVDPEPKRYLEKKTKRGFVSFLSSPIFNSYNNGTKGRRGGRRFYGSNFAKSDCILSNYIIQNNLEKCIDVVSYYYKRELPEFETTSQDELDITRDIIKSLVRKLNTIKYDFRKLNFNILQSEVTAKVKEMMMQVSPGEQLKCLESSPGLTLGKIYKVDSYEISSNGNLIVFLINDLGTRTSYNYRLFESLTNHRENHINELLNFI
jgi:hypothetical protein